MTFRYEADRIVCEWVQEENALAEVRDSLHLADSASPSSRIGGSFEEALSSALETHGERTVMPWSLEEMHSVVPQYLSLMDHLQLCS